MSQADDDRRIRAFCLGLGVVAVIVLFMPLLVPPGSRSLFIMMPFGAMVGLVTGQALHSILRQEKDD